MQPSRNYLFLLFYCGKLKYFEKEGLILKFH